MLDFLKKDKEDKPQNTADGSEQGDTGNEVDDKTQHGPDVEGGVPKPLKEKLAEIRGESEKDFEMVEVDDNGNIVKDEEGNPIVITDASDEEIADAKDGDTTSDDVVQTKDATDVDGTVAEADTNPSVGELELDPRLVEAGKKMGWSEDKIISIAKTDMSILTDLADRFEEKDTQHRQEETNGDAQDKGDVGLSDSDKAKLKEKFGDEVAAIIISQSEQNAALKAELSDVQEFKKSTKEKAEQQAEFRRFEVASELLDNASKHFPELGLTKDLPVDSDGNIVLDSTQMKARGKIYDTAKMFHKNNGGTFSSAVNEALSWYAGSSGKTIAQREIVKDLNDRKQRFSPKPSRRKMAKVYKNPDAKGAAIVAAAKKQAGIT